MANEEGHPLGFFVHPTLVLKVVLSEHETLIAGVDDDGVVHLPGLLEVLKKTGQIVINPLHAAKEFLEIGVVCHTCVFFVAVAFGIKVARELGRKARGEIHEVIPAGIAGSVGGSDMRDECISIAPGGKGTPAWVSLPKCFGLGNIDILEIILIAESILEIIVGSFVMVHQEEWFFLIPALLEPLEGYFSDDIGGVFSLELDRVLLPGLVATDTELGIKIRSLPGEDGVIVEVGRFVLEVPLSDHSGVVSRFTELDGEGLLSGRHPAGQVKGSVGVIVLPGEDTGPGGRADGVGAKGVFKKSAFLGEAIDRWGGRDFGKPAPIGGDSVRGMIVRHDVEDIGPGVVFVFVLIGEGKAGKEDQDR